MSQIFESPKTSKKGVETFWFLDAGTGDHSAVVLSHLEFRRFLEYETISCHTIYFDSILTKQMTQSHKMDSRTLTLQVSVNLAQEDGQDDGDALNSLDRTADKVRTEEVFLIGSPWEDCSSPGSPCHGTGPGALPGLF